METVKDVCPPGCKHEDELREQLAGGRAKRAPSSAETAPIDGIDISNGSISLHGSRTKVRDARPRRTT